MLNSTDEKLLMALRRGNHFKANPGDIVELLSAELDDIGPSEGQSSARRLKAERLADFVDDESGAGRTLMRITDQGIAYADITIEHTREKTLPEKFKSITRSDWIALGAFVVSIIALFKD